jgi:hypothetical protein
MRRAIAVVLLTLWSDALAQATTVQLTFISEVSHLSLPLQGDCCPVALGDSVVVSVTFDASSPLTGPAPAVDTYMDAVMEITATFTTSAGVVTYSASPDITSDTVNSISVRTGDIYFHVSDYDFNGSEPPLFGPAFNAAADGSATLFTPWFLAFEIGGDFDEYLAADRLPESPLDAASYARLTVGFYPGGAYEAFSFAPVIPVPEPATGSHLLAVAALLILMRAFSSQNPVG